MKKFLLIAVAFFSFNQFVNATEPADVSWVHSLTISQLFVGDYAFTSTDVAGKAHIQGSDGKLYSWATNTVYGRLMYNTALAAKVTGKKISIVKGNAYINGDVNNFTLYRLALAE